MEKLLKHKNLPWAVLAAGALGIVLEIILLASGGDNGGLLVRGHFAYTLLWILTFAASALLVLGTWDLTQAAKFSFNFPPSVIAAAGTAAAAAGVLVATVRNLFAVSDFLVLMDVILGLLSCAALVFISRCRWKGMHPSVIFHAVVCVYLMVDLVCVYRLRSSDPQVESYCFSLLASVCIMLASYYNAAFAANSGNRRMHTLTHLAAVYFCLLSLPWGDNAVFYLTMAAWIFTDLCNLTPMPRNMR